MPAKVNEITEVVIGAAIEVHRALGPGLLEGAYRECLCHELRLRAIPFQREKPLPLLYKGMTVETAYRLDILVADLVIVELKCVERLIAVHEAQLMSYMKLGGWQAGLLINFNVPILKDGIRRKVLGLKE